MRNGDGPAPFDFKPDDNCGHDWKKWLRGFEIYAQANAIKKTKDKLNWMLHYAGPKVQEVFYSLPETEDTGVVRSGPYANGYVFPRDEYNDGIAKLNGFFEPKQNVSYERHVFRQQRQKKNERFDMFLVRLREQADRCNFGEQLDDNIRDQITSGCCSDVLRRKILERGDAKLEKIVKIAQIIEIVAKQQETYGKDATPSSSMPISESKDESVCKIEGQHKFNSRKRFSSNNFDGFCGRCGSKGHKSADEKCPARGKTCNSCGRKDHFARKCFLQGNGNRSTKFMKRKSTTIGNDHTQSKMKREEVQMVESKVSLEPKQIEDEYEDIFCIDSASGGNKMWCIIGGIDTEVVIDSGSRYNIVDRASWMEMKAKGIETMNQQKEVDVNFRAYGDHPLKFLGKFEAIVRTNKVQTTANFYVANEFGKVLLGYETATALGVLKIGHDTEQKVNVNAIDSKVMNEVKEFPKIKGVVIDIPIKADVKGVVQPYRRVPAPLEKMVDDKIDEMLRQGIIERVEGVSKWVSPLVCAPKDIDDVRICVDMRRANEAVERENHPLPTMEDFQPHLGEAKWFSKLDVKQAYHQVEISTESREITTFMTRKGLFRYTRLMFGINCAPEIFQKLMEQILNGCEGVMIFIDDVVVHAPTKELHDVRLRKVLNRFRQFTVLLNKDKCKFGVTEVNFIGHCLSASGIRPTYDKIEAVKSFREPKSIEETRSFLGLVNYVGKFIPNLATISEPLRQLTKKDANFEWGPKQQESFESLKQSLTNEMALGYYNVKSRTQVIADASPVGLGAVLVQFQEGDPRVIAYASRSLTAPEINYAQTEKEALALVWATERFHYFLFGRHFELVTDHKALETLFGPKSKPCARIERWVIRLMSYKFKVIYKPGKTNIADPLSRLLKSAGSETGESDDTEEYIRWIVSYAEPKAIKIGEIEMVSQQDDEIQAVKSAIDSNEWTGKAMAFKPFETELCFAGSILLRGTRIVMPQSLREQTLQLAHEGHPGMTIMKRRLRVKVWWPKMDSHVEDFVKKCRGCLLVSTPSAPEPLKTTKLPSTPWEAIAIDYLGPLPSGHSLLVVVDYYSRYMEVKVMTKIDSFETIKRLKAIFARFGNPKRIKADNGRQFDSAEFRQFCNVNDIELNSTIPYWPQQNGEVERQNRSLLKRLIICQNEKGNWLEDLQEFLLMYRSSPHSTTLKSPAELMFNRNIRNKLPSIEQQMDENIDGETRDRDAKMKQKGKDYADQKRRAKINDVKEGDEVVAKRQIYTNKLATTFEPTVYKVIERKGSELTIENSGTGTKYRRNVAHVKKVPNHSIAESQPTLITSPNPPDQSMTTSSKPPPRKRRMPSYYQDFDLIKRRKN